MLGQSYKNKLKPSQTSPRGYHLATGVLGVVATDINHDNSHNKNLGAS
jgi:hypothetical protein